MRFFYIFIDKAKKALISFHCWVRVNVGYIILWGIYLWLLCIAVLITLIGYPIALVIFGLIGMAVPASDMLLEKKGQSSFLRSFVSHCANHPENNKTNYSCNYDDTAPIPKSCDTFFGQRRRSDCCVKHKQSTQNEHNEADCKPYPSVFTHTQPPKGEK
jgi:hypothetical protein